jgi:Raf kinase inhibitor-like YbhB/YbcL family protein
MRAFTKTTLALTSFVLAAGGALGAACSSADSADSAGSAGGASSGAPSVDGAASADGSSGGTDGATGDANVSTDSGPGTDAATEGGNDADATPGTFTLTSTAFAANGSIPAIHTCDGTNASPPLAWTDPPSGTQSYAVVMRDLSLGASPNYHWVIYDIPAATTSLPQAVEAVASPSVPAGAKQTYWSFGEQYSYLGPCPPSGTHDYQLTVYSFATPTIAVGAPGTDPAAADTVIQANKTGSATLTGKYMR